MKNTNIHSLNEHLLKDKWALVTGASSGIGLEIARNFARHKCNLILVARSKKALELLKKELLSKYAISVIILIKDLSTKDASKEVFTYIKKKNITVSYLINNAGFGVFGKFTDIPSEKQFSMLQLNMVALTELTYYFSKDMVKNSFGKILLVSSVAGFMPIPYFSAYAATKSYVLSLSLALHEELKDSRVTVTALCPGPTKTGFAKVADMDEKAFFSENIPSAKEVADFGFDKMMKGVPVAIHGKKNVLSVALSRLVPKKLYFFILRKIMK